MRRGLNVTSFGVAKQRKFGSFSKPVLTSLGRCHVLNLRNSSFEWMRAQMDEGVDAGYRNQKFRAGPSESQIANRDGRARGGAVRRQ